MRVRSHGDQGPQSRQGRESESSLLDDVLGALILGKASFRTMSGNVIVAVLFNIAGMVLALLPLLPSTTCPACLAAYTGLLWAVGLRKAQHKSVACTRKYRLQRLGA